MRVAHIGLLPLRLRPVRRNGSQPQIRGSRALERRPVLSRVPQWLGRRLSGWGRPAFASARYAVNAAIVTDSATIATMIAGRKP